MKFNFLAADMPAILIPIILVAVFGLIVILVIVLKRHVSIFKDNEKPKSDKEIAAEELDHILQPVDELKPEIEEEEPEEGEAPAEEPKPEEKKEEGQSDDAPKA